MSTADVRQQAIEAAMDAINTAKHPLSCDIWISGGGCSCRAQAIAAVDALIAAGVATHNTAIQAVLDLHEKVPTGLGYSVCAVCKDPDWNDANSVWPCPTVALLVPTSTSKDGEK